MLVYSLAQTLRRCCVPQLQPHSKLHHVLLDATRLRSVERSTLMHLLEVRVLFALHEIKMGEVVITFYMN